MPKRSESYSIHEVTVGDRTHYRYSLRREGGHTYHSPFFFHTREAAEDKARRALANERD